MDSPFTTTPARSLEITNAGGIRAATRSVPVARPRLDACSYTPDMRQVKRSTVPGLGPRPNDIDAQWENSQDAFFERAPVSCRPAVSLSSTPPSRYSYVAPRRQTLSMPLPETGDIASRRRPTSRPPMCVGER